MQSNVEPHAPGSEYWKILKNCIGRDTAIECTMLVAGGT